MTKIIEHIRKRYYPQTTIGELYLNNSDIFCYTLEDTVRPPKIKVKHFTAIPEGSYFITTRYSPSFKRDMLLLYSDETKTKISNGIIEFSWIYAHGGNKHTDTSGCVIVGYKWDVNTVSSSAEADLFKIVKSWLDDGHEVIWKVINSKQEN
jgi:hypothetical protein